MAQWKKIVMLVNKGCLSLDELTSWYDNFPLAIREQQAVRIEESESKQHNCHSLLQELSADDLTSTMAYREAQLKLRMNFINNDELLQEIEELLAYERKIIEDNKHELWSAGNSKRKTAIPVTSISLSQAHELISQEYKCAIETGVQPCEAYLTVIRNSIAQNGNVMKLYLSTDHTKLEPKRPVSEACQILFGKINDVLEHFKQMPQLLQYFWSLIEPYIVQWKNEQKRPYSLDKFAGLDKYKIKTLHLMCEKVYILIMKTCHQVSQLKEIVSKSKERLNGHSSGTEETLVLVMNQLSDITYNLLKNSFVVLQQPSKRIIISRGQKEALSATVGFLGLTKGTISIRAGLVRSDELNSVLNNLDVPHLCMPLSNGTQSCSTSSQHNFLHANFENLRAVLPLFINENETSFTPFFSEAENASEIKYYISFIASIEGPLVNCQTIAPVIPVVSLPIIFINQLSECDLAEGTLFWHDSFLDCHVSEEVEVYCDELVEKLRLLFKYRTEKDLDESQLNCLEELASEISTSKDESGKKTVKQSQFLKANMPNANFSMWKWLTGCINFIEANFDNKQKWQNGLITGFIRKDASNNALRSSEVGTFIIRFSETKILTTDTSFQADLSVAVLDKEEGESESKVIHIKCDSPAQLSSISVMLHALAHNNRKLLHNLYISPKESRSLDTAFPAESVDCNDPNYKKAKVVLDIASKKDSKPTNITTKFNQMGLVQREEMPVDAEDDQCIIGSDPMLSFAGPLHSMFSPRDAYAEDVVEAIQENLIK